MDIRTPVGAIFAIYGVLLFVWGLLNPDVAPRHMLLGVGVNIVAGVGMLIFGGVLLLLARRSPSVPRSTAEPLEERQGP